MSKEKKVRDPYEIEVEAKASNIAGICVLSLACIYLMYEVFLGKGINPALYSIMALYCAIMYGYKGIKIERARKLNITSSIIWFILTIMLILNYFKII